MVLRVAGRGGGPGAAALGPAVLLLRRHSSHEVEPVHVGRLAGPPQERLGVLGADGGVLGAGVPQVPGQLARVDLRDADDADNSEEIRRDQGCAQTARMLETDEEGNADATEEEDDGDVKDRSRANGDHRQCGSRHARCCGQSRQRSHLDPEFEAPRNPVPIRRRHGEPRHGVHAPGHVAHLHREHTRCARR